MSESEGVSDEDEGVGGIKFAWALVSPRVV